MKKVFFSVILFFMFFSLVYSENYFTKVSVQGGELHHIEICKKDPNVIYTGSMEGGLWVSKDGGATWQETSFFKTAGCGTNVFAVCQNEPNIIIAAAIIPNVLALYGQPQLYRSEDYGETWQVIGISAGSNFTKILNSKKNPDEFYLLTHSGPDYPKVLKSTNKGITWTELSREAIRDNFLTNPAIDMTLDDNNNLFVVACDNTPPIGKQIGYWLGNRYLQLGEARFGYVFVSTDNVNTFHSVIIASASFQTNPFDYQFYRPAPWAIVSGSNTIAIAAVTYSTFTADKYYAIYVATSTEESVWEEQNKEYDVISTVFIDTWTCHGIKFNKISTSVVVDVGFSMAVSSDGQKIYFYDPQKRKVLVSTFSATGGFGEFFECSTDFLDIQANDFVIDPTNPNKMFICDQSRYGILVSSDGGKTWNSSNNGINALVVYDGCKSPDGTIYVLTKMAVYKSPDGTNWTEIFSTTTPKGNALELDEGVISSPKENLVIVSADGYVYRSEDSGSTWELVLISSYPPTKSIVFRNDNSGVGYIAFREPNPGEIVGYKTNRKYIYKTTDWAKTWSPLDMESMSVQCLTIDPKQQNVLYASFGEIAYWEPRTYIFGGFKKIIDNDDGKVSIEIISPENKDLPVKVFINPDDPSKMYGAVIMYTGDEMGSENVYGNFGISMDGGKSWADFGITYFPSDPTESIPEWNKSLYDIKYSSHILYWANDRGIFAVIDNTKEVKWLAKPAEVGGVKCLILGSLYTGTSTGLYKLTRLPTALSIQIDKPKVYCYPNPCDLSKGQKVTLKYLVPQNKKVDWLKISIYNIAGELVYELPKDQTDLTGGFGYYYEWDGKNQSGNTCARGVYIAVFKSNLDIARTKIVLVK